MWGEEAQRPILALAHPHFQTSGKSRDSTFPHSALGSGGGGELDNGQIVPRVTF